MGQVLSMIKSVAEFAANHIAEVVRHETDCEASGVSLVVRESVGAHPSSLVYALEIPALNESFEFVCSETTVEHIMDKTSEAVRYALFADVIRQPFVCQCAKP